MIIAFTAEKGGVGKSTTAINFAVYLAEQGYDVCLVDADKQQTVSNWIAHRNDAIEQSGGLLEINSVQKLDNIKAALKDLDRRYEFVIVDCAGRDSKEMRTALLVAHKSIIPLKCSQADFETLGKMHGIIDQAKETNEELQIYVLRSIASTNPAIKEEKEIKEAIENFYPDLPVLDAIIRDRKVFRDAYPEGKAIFELENPNKKAIVEFEKFAREVLKDDD